MNNDFLLYALIGTGVLLIWFFIKNAVKPCPPDKIMIIFGMKDRNLPYKIVAGRTTLIIPFLQYVKYLDLTVFKKQYRFNAKDETGEKLHFDLTVEFAISNDHYVLKNAVEKLLDLPLERIENLGEQIIHSGAKRVIDHKPVKRNDHLKLEYELSEEILHELESLGFDLVNINILFF